MNAMIRTMKLQGLIHTRYDVLSSFPADERDTLRASWVVVVSEMDCS